MAALQVLLVLGMPFADCRAIPEHLEGEPFGSKQCAQRVACTVVKLGMVSRR